MSEVSPNLSGSRHQIEKLKTKLKTTVTGCTIHEHFGPTSFGSLRYSVSTKDRKAPFASKLCERVDFV